MSFLTLVSNKMKTRVLGETESLI
uniref:Uncharacterized protein n=1 Tax=Rhizophora mucronata TaxID=61149 RepID=A0A2P2QWG7_RHIMU